MKKNVKNLVICLTPEVLKKTKEFKDELNRQYKNGEFEASKKEVKSKFSQKKVEKISLKSFTEAALLYFVENKIDPTLYNDATLKTEITRLRNQLFSFNVIHEQKILKEFSSLEAALEASTKSISTETIEGNNETQSFIAGLLEVMFQVFEVKGDEREKIVIAFKKKMIEFQDFNA
jgi:hypothetical protein